MKYLPLVGLALALLFFLPSVHAEENCSQLGEFCGLYCDCCAHPQSLTCDFSSSFCVLCDNTFPFMDRHSMGGDLKCEYDCSPDTVSPFCDEHLPGHFDLDTDECCYWECQSLDCDESDDYFGYMDPLLLIESEVTEDSCFASCTDNMSCCDIQVAVCDPSVECMLFEELVTNNDADTPHMVCFISNSGVLQWGASAEEFEENCYDGFDNDCDGYCDRGGCNGMDPDPDCICQNDEDCPNTPPCVEGRCNQDNHECYTWIVPDNESCEGESGVCCGGFCCGPGMVCSSTDGCIPVEKGCSEAGDGCSNDTDCCDGLVCCEEVCNATCDAGSTGCEPGTLRLCEKQEGVCNGSFISCTGEGSWPVCDYFGWNSSYQEPESTCSDGLDNDCDGLTDCGVNGGDPDGNCALMQYLGCYGEDVYWLGFCDDIPNELNKTCSVDDSCAFGGCVNGECTVTNITECDNTTSDGCCPSGCTPLSDFDCTCTSTECGPIDGCCPSGCTPANDGDCEECQEGDSCSDNNPCTVDSCVGGVCSHGYITSCESDDGCCPADCYLSDDSDCKLASVNNPPQVFINYPQDNRTYPSLEVVFTPMDDENQNLWCSYKLDTGRWLEIDEAIKSYEKVAFNLTVQVPINGRTKHDIYIKCNDGSNETPDPPSKTFYLGQEFIAETPPKENYSTPPPNDSIVTQNETSTSEPEVITVIQKVIKESIPWEILTGFLLLILIILIGFLAYSRLSAKKAAEEASKAVLEKEESRSREERLGWLKDRQVILKKRIGELVNKEATLGLSGREEAMNKSYKEELVKTEEELLESEEFEEELEERAQRAWEEALAGVPSKNIMQELVDEGYTKKEIEHIKKLFRGKKSPIEED